MAQEPLAGVGSEGLAEANAGKPVIDPNKNTREEGKRIAQTFILRLTALAKALRYIPGQKHFIFFSTGVPSSLIYVTAEDRVSKTLAHVQGALVITED